MSGFMAEYYNWTSHSKEDYFKALSVPQVSEEPTQLAMLRVIIYSRVMNNIWIGRRGWFLMQPGRVILLLLMKLSLMILRGLVLWLLKDDADLEYCKFCGDARYKPARGRDPHRKKSTYTVLRYLPLTPRLQRLYSLRMTVEHMTWHAHTDKGGVDASSLRYRGVEAF
ncbi:UNVERIFIED_CONTAM: hypothetical protein Scaly_2431400 [Sesamum calycinum]|uniref:Uncharacterized protein n=1 Tax=Sesamum calycinum TaxID=2727403 RepID=A0AAW2M0L8_9LAMI